MTDSPGTPGSRQGGGAPGTTPANSLSPSDAESLDAEIQRLAAQVRVTRSAGAPATIAIDPSYMNAASARIEAKVDETAPDVMAKLLGQHTAAQVAAVAQEEAAEKLVADLEAEGALESHWARRNPFSDSHVGPIDTAAMKQEIAEAERTNAQYRDILADRVRTAYAQLETKQREEREILAQRLRELGVEVTAPIGTPSGPISPRVPNALASAVPDIGTFLVQLFGTPVEKEAAMAELKRRAQQHPPTYFETASQMKESAQFDSVAATPGASDFNKLEDRPTQDVPVGAPPWSGAGVVHRYKGYVIFDLANRRRTVTTEKQLHEDAHAHERWAAEDAARKEKAGPPLYLDAHKAPPPDDVKLARMSGIQGNALCATCTHAVLFVAPHVNPSGHDVFHQKRSLCSKVFDEDGESLEINEVPVQYCSSHRPSLRKVAWRWAERNAETSAVAKRFLPIIRTVIRSY